MAVALLEEFGIGDARERDEAWRYSKLALRALAQNDFVVADGRAALSANLAARFDWPQSAGCRLVFVNGVFSASQSDAGALDGVAIEHHGNAMTLTFSRDEQDVHLVYASVPDAKASRWSADLKVVVRAGGVRIVEQHIGDAGGADVLGSLCAQVSVGEHAALHTTLLTDLSDAQSLYRREVITSARDGTYASTHALFGGRLQRHDVNVQLAGTQSSYRARGVFALRGRQHVDVHLEVRHAARDTTSDVLWRGVADQRARGILHGAITVNPAADGADARLQTKNLLLSPHAEIDAQPVLEIYADEVKASHGATVGQLDETALFYLRSRGIPAAQARNLMIAGFCREVFAAIDDAALRAQLEAELDQRLPNAEVTPP
jgi:Fe-S cluster assembly protein SufD